ncbi:hypothetical protein MRX96_002177 [Rhipicephalus microplus]
MLQVKQKRPDPKSRDFPAPLGPECSGLCDLPGAEYFPEDSPTKQFYKDKQLLCRVGNEQKGKYPPELRAFALTLHF